MKVRLRLKTENKIAALARGSLPGVGVASGVSTGDTVHVQGRAAATPQREAAVPPNLSSPTGQKNDVTATDILRVFGGGRIIAIDKPLSCSHCSGKNVPKWRRGGKIIEARWPDGRVTMQCHFCGREVAA